MRLMLSLVLWLRMTMWCKNKYGYTLNEFMVAMAIGMVVILMVIKLYSISSLLAQKQLVNSKLNLVSDEVSFHLRNLINFSIFKPICINDFQWQQNIYLSQNSEALVHIRERLKEPIRIFQGKMNQSVLDLKEQNLVTHPLYSNIKMLEYSDYVEVVQLIPILKSSSDLALNNEELWGSLDKLALFTDCRSSYLTLLSRNDSSGDYEISNEDKHYIYKNFPELSYLQGYLVQSNIIYLTKENRNFYLATHFLDGSHRYLIKDVVYFKVLNSDNHHTFWFDTVVSSDKPSTQTESLIDKLIWNGKTLGNQISVQHGFSDYKRSLIVVKGFNL